MKKKPMGAGGKKSFKGKGKKKRPPKRIKKKIVKQAPPNIEITGMESLYLKELVESEKDIIVVLANGEEIRGRVRYYDRDVFSIGPSDGSPKIFIRKSGIKYLYEV